MALLGSIFVLATLVSDPFAQQLIIPTNCAQIDPLSNATTACTSFYSDFGSHYMAGPGLLDLKAQMAINRGAFGGPQDLQIQPDCRTGNCTFPPYFTLGFSSSCVDVSDQIGYVNFTGQGGRTSGLDLAGGAYTFQDETTLVSWNQSTIYPTYLQISSMDQGSTFLVLTGFLAGRSAQSGPDINNMRPSACNGSWVCQGFGAASCSLRASIKSVVTQVNAGNLVENAKTVIDFGEGGYALAKEDCLKEKGNESAIASGKPLTSENGTWLQYPINIYGNASHVWSVDTPAAVSDNDPGNISLDPDCGYAMPLMISGSFAKYLNTFLTGHLTTQSSYPWIPHQAQVGADPLFNQFFQAGNLTFDSVSDIFQGIANSISTYIRQNGNKDYSKPAQGVIYYEDVCIRVRWAWLIYPCSLAVLVIGFLLIVMVQSVRHGQSDWKTSTLPILFHGLQNMPNTQQDLLTQHSDMEKRAEATRVRYALTDEGWRLVDCASPNS